MRIKLKYIIWIVCLLMTFSACSTITTTTGSTEPDFLPMESIVPSDSLNEEQLNATFEVLKANYFILTIAEYSDTPDASKYFKPEGERVGALYNLMRDTGEKLDVYEDERLILFDKEYAGSCWDDGWNEGSMWAYYEEYEKRLEGTLCCLSYSFDKYLDEESLDNKGFTFGKWVHDDSLAYFRLPAEEVKSNLLSAKEMTEERAIADAKDILSSLSADLN